MKTNQELMTEAKAELKGNWGPLVLVTAIMLSLFLLTQMFDDIRNILDSNLFLHRNTTSKMLDSNFCTQKNWQEVSCSSDIHNNMQQEKYYDINFEKHMEVLKDLFLEIRKPVDEVQKDMKASMMEINYTGIFFVLLIFFIITPTLNIGKTKMYMQLIRESKVELNNLSYGFYNNFAIIIKANIRVSIGFVLWAILFLVPGFIYLFSIALYGFILAERTDLNTKEIFALSTQMMRGHKWQLFCLVLRFSGWALLSLLSFFMGFLWVGPYFNYSFTKFYEEVKLEHGGFPDQATHDNPIIP